jgi:type VI secretion system FHA domain protein
MPLILTMTQTKGAQSRSGGDRQIRTLGHGTLSIGRAAGNDWVLPDPEQHLSRTHCMISFEGGRYMLTDLSTNGMLINGAREPTTRNSRLVLTDGDTVQLGTWQLSVAESDDPAGAAGGASGFGASNFIVPRGDALAPAGAGGEGPLDIDPLDDPLGHAFENSAAAGFQHPMPHLPPAVRAEDPFDLAENERKRARGPDEDLFRGESSAEAWTGPVQHDHADIGSHAFIAPRAVTPVNVNDIDFDDLLGDFAPTPAPHPLAPPPPAAPVAPTAPPAGFPAGFNDALDDLLGDFAPAPAGGPAAPAPLPPAPPPPFPAPFAAPVPASPVAPMRAAPPPPPLAASPAAPPPAILPVATAPQAPPPVAAVAPASPFDAASVATTGGGSAAPADQAALFAAFAEGAGLPQVDLLAGQGAQADPRAAMRAIGALFAAFVAGTREVLMSRAEIKHEMRVEQTMMRARDNNALKFSISAQEALVALLHPSRPGYKAPLAAVEEAFNDIRSHEMAVMAGLQTALIALLKRFDPEALESRLQRGMLDAVLPGARKARFWELFCATYKDIATEAQDDFQSIFGREFARAYDAQIRKL